LRAERQIRTLMRAWPRPDRTERGEEIVGTTLDLLPDGATRLPMLLALNLVIGGLRARWRMRPPVWRWAFYRMGGRLPTRWNRWVLNDLTAPGWRRRVAMSRLILSWSCAVLGVIAAETATHHALGSIWPYMVELLIAVGIATLVRARKDRDRQLVRHGCG
jgi:hypothetical protein